MKTMIFACLASAAMAMPLAAQDKEVVKEVEEVEIVSKGDHDPLGALEESEMDGKKHVVIKKEIRKGEGAKEGAMEARARRMMSDCAGRSFETEAMVKNEAGEVRKTRIKLCGDKDNDDAWVETLISAKKKIALAEEISEESRAAIIADLDAEISRTIADEDG
ncbi:hypothetical protein [Sphingomicrobium lutaoense]|uniref:Uncharacterized protein n=1 Tax=Sphingomicrobium lutaoense TaxID=515949 RepID=A0A839Z0V8_9SPHN|nr:hypothetical protein [Sphingomicrobium lutaoense]MBB3764188.1 hypothetical protein [Sphingomicrobium lutaoense]